MPAKKFFTSEAKSEARLVWTQRYYMSIKGRAQCLWKGADQRARKKGCEFTITPEWVEERLLDGRCALTGLPFVLVVGKGKHPFSPSIDKIDQTRGYTPDNSRLIILAANMGRGAWSDDVLTLWAKALVEQQEGR